MADTAYLSVTMRYTGEKIGTYKKTLQGKTYDVVKVKSVFIFDGTATINGISRDIDWVYYDEAHFAYGLGLIREICPLAYWDFGLGPIPSGGMDLEVKEVFIQE